MKDPAAEPVIKEREGTGTILDYLGGAMGDPDAPAAKPGKPAEFPLGVLYQGPWQTPADGFNEHVRRSARALALSGVPVQLQGLMGGATINPGLPQSLPADLVEVLNCSMSRYSVRVQQAVLTPSLIHNLTTHRFLSPDELRQHNYLRVIYTVFETDRLRQEVIQGLGRVGQVWVACERNAAVLRDAGIDHVRVVPVPYFDDDPLIQMRARERRPGAPRFYHIGKWEPRKSQDAIILAFMRAFAPGDAYLVLKITKLLTPIKGYPQDPEAAIALALQDAEVQRRGWTQDKAARHVQVVAQRLSTEQIHALHRISDCYITLSRGEGFDMPGCAAKLAGNLLVYTPSGGPNDYATRGDLEVPATGWVQRHEFYKDWDPEARYIDFDVEQAVTCLRTACDKIHARERGTPPSERYRAQNVGQDMRRHLEDLLRPIGAPLFERTGKMDGWRERERLSDASTHAAETAQNHGEPLDREMGAREPSGNDAKGDALDDGGGKA